MNDNETQVPINCFDCLDMHKDLNTKEMQDYCRLCLNHIPKPGDSDFDLDPSVLEEADEDATTGHLARRGW
jgi:hypothetical protein